MTERIMTEGCLGDVLAASEPVIKFDLSLGLSDLDNSKRLVQQFGDRLRWCKELGWLWYDGKRWKRDSLDRVIEAAKALPSFMVKAGMDMHSDAGEALRVWGLRSKTNARINAMVSLAHSDIDIAISILDLDCYPGLFNLSNGILDLESMTLRPHSPEYLITKVSPVEYRPEVGSEGLFRRVLDDVLPRDVYEYILRLYGYGMTGTAVEHVLPILWGLGQNGKTLIQEYVAWLYGDYAVAANEDLLIERKNSEHPTEIARLYGARLVYCSETGETARLNEKRVKKLTGGNTQTGRYMHKDFFDFQPSWLLTVDTNYKPLIRGNDDGIWRRVSLIPFSIRIEDGKKDEQLRDKLRVGLEASKALNLVLIGYAAWKAAARDCRLCPPPDVEAASNSYRSDMDDAGRFVAECCERGVGYSAGSKGLYMAYVQWAESESLSFMNETTFGRKLLAMGIDTARVNVPGSGCTQKMTMRLGLRLREEYVAESEFIARYSNRRIDGL